MRTFFHAFILFIAIGATSAVFAQTHPLDGQFVGVGPAEGMSYSARVVGSRLTGSFLDPTGVRVELDLPVEGQVAQGLAFFADLPLFIFIEPIENGVGIGSVVITEDGTPIESSAQAVDLIRAE